MNKSKELIKNTIIIFIGKFSTQFITFLLLPIYTRVLSTSDYGYVDLIQTYLALLVPIIALRLDTGVFRFLIDVRDNNREKSKIISSTSICLIFQLVLLSIIFIIVNLFIKINYFTLILLDVISMACSSVILQTTRGLGFNKDYSISSIISALVTIIGNVLFLIVFKLGISGVFLSTFIANISCVTYLVIKNKIYKYIKINMINKKDIHSLLKYSLPMIPNGLSWWVLNVSDRTILTYFISAAANGIYSVSCKFSSILSSLFTIFNMSWQETVSLHINDSDRDDFFSNVTENVLNLFNSLCLGIIVCMPWIFNIIIGEKYIQAYEYIPLLLLGNVFNALIGILGGIYIAKKNTKEVAKTTVFAAIINLLIDLLLVKFIGIYAAVLSTVISYFIMTIYRYIDVQKYVKIKIRKTIIILNIFAYSITTILYYLNNTYLNILNFVFVCTFALVINRNFIKNIFLGILKKRGKRYVK